MCLWPWSVRGCAQSGDGGRRIQCGQRVDWGCAGSAGWGQLGGVQGASALLRSWGLSL